MASVRECRCSRPTDGFSCRECANEAAKHLRTIAGLVGLLDAKRARIKGFSYSGAGSRSAENPMPYDPRVSRVEKPIRIALVTSALALAERGHIPPRTENLAPVALWLAGLTGDIRMQQQAPDEFSRFDVCASNLVALFDRPPDQLYLGTCGAQLEDAKCSEPVYVEAKRVLHAGREEIEGATSVVQCPHCRASIDVAERRNMAREALRGYQATISELVAFKALVGVSRRTLFRAVSSGAMPQVGDRMERNIRGQWRRVPTYRFCDAMDLAKDRAA